MDGIIGNKNMVRRGINIVSKFPTAFNQHLVPTASLETVWCLLATSGISKPFHYDPFWKIFRIKDFIARTLGNMNPVVHIDLDIGMGNYVSHIVDLSRLPKVIKFRCIFHPPHVINAVIPITEMDLVLRSIYILTSLPTPFEGTASGSSILSFVQFFGLVQSCPAKQKACFGARSDKERYAICTVPMESSWIEVHSPASSMTLFPWSVSTNPPPSKETFVKGRSDRKEELGPVEKDQDSDEAKVIPSRSLTPEIPAFKVKSYFVPYSKNWSEITRITRQSLLTQTNLRLESKKPSSPLINESGSISFEKVISIEFSIGTSKEPGKGETERTMGGSVLESCSELSGVTSDPPPGTGSLPADVGTGVEPPPPLLQPTKNKRARERKNETALPW